MPVRTGERRKLEVSPMGTPVFPTRTRRHIMGSAVSLLPPSAAWTRQRISRRYSVCRRQHISQPGPGYFKPSLLFSSAVA